VPRAMAWEGRNLAQRPHMEGIVAWSNERGKQLGRLAQPPAASSKTVDQVRGRTPPFTGSVHTTD
jgi:hypothetical protein